jgi:hypothetical protein
MANKRQRKKAEKTRETELVMAMGQTDSLYAIRKVVVTLDCPCCAHPTLERRFLPAVGSLNGTVACPRCAHEAPYAQVLARSMECEDPLPPAYRSPETVPALMELDALPPWSERAARVIEQVLFVVFGIRRRWRFA